MNNEALDKKSIIRKFAVGREDFLVKSFIAHGPASLKEYLEVNEETWRVIFDYLIFHENVLYKVITQSREFFLDIYIKHGMTGVREILEVTDTKYDEIWEVIFDFLAISDGGLFYHVMEHRNRYSIALKARGGDFLRKVLGIWKDKYKDHWSQILDIILAGVCDDFFAERTFDQGLEAFSRMMNGVREHRPVFKSGILF